MENKYERKRRLEKKASLSPLYVLEKFKDYIAYIDPQLDKQANVELIKAIRALNYELLEAITEAAYLDREKKEAAWKVLSIRLKALFNFLRMAVGDGRKYISVKTYEHASKLLCELGQLFSLQLKKIAA